MPQLRQEGDIFATGNISGGSMTIPSGSVTDSSIAANAGVQRTKVVQQFALNHYQTTGTAVVAATQDIHIARAAGTVVAVEAAVTGAIATGGDRTVTIDVLKSTGAAAFATILSAALVLDNTNVLRTLEAATVNSAAYVDGDLFRITVAVAGAAGNQAQGLIVTVTMGENPQ